MASREYIWTPQDMGALAALNLTKAAYRAYSVAVRFADRRTGCFTLSKTVAAAQMQSCKRTADRGLALLVERGILACEDAIFRDGRQRSNSWRLRPREMWQTGMIFARAKLEAIREKLKAQKRVRQLRLQLLNGVNFGSPVPQPDLLTEEEVAQLKEKMVLSEKGGQPLVVSASLLRTKIVRAKEKECEG